MDDIEQFRDMLLVEVLLHDWPGPSYFHAAVSLAQCLFDLDDPDFQSLFEGVRRQLVTHDEVIEILKLAVDELLMGFDPQNTEH